MKKYNNDILNNMSRLKWASRRGMLELDVILSNFLREAYANLATDKKIAFVKLLECTDPELFAWLLGRETPTDPELAEIVNVIKDHARSRI